MDSVVGQQTNGIPRVAPRRLKHQHEVTKKKQLVVTDLRELALEGLNILQHILIKIQVSLNDSRKTRDKQS